ncbi:unnamed protein product [Ambrosiozyma monospora]|uniref:Unnamed protein product n=1 Tax=Ambrosiozyma monospora TaxID=43982 RepID=A0ACB5T8N1_AMBMO|nr:unnamed protein product [Ambrosiozyma monospora]
MDGKADNYKVDYEEDNDKEKNVGDVSGKEGIDSHVLPPIIEASNEPSPNIEKLEQNGLKPNEDHSCQKQNAVADATNDHDHDDAKENVLNHTQQQQLNKQNKNEIETKDLSQSELSFNSVSFLPKLAHIVSDVSFETHLENRKKKRTGSGSGSGFENSKGADGQVEDYEEDDEDDEEHMIVSADLFSEVDDLCESA